ncbi:unnamed protein product [Citrullus colocynthis]|uniref:DUF4283 domain-containing protein n=1 Tax=Citrullus colocynthis TaxID=252529 RepID=A0ABP0XMD0_9ROSI
METEELLENWKNFRLSEEERVTKIDFDPRLGSLIDGQLDHCLVGKLLTTRTIVPEIIKNVFANAWRTKLSFNVGSLGKNLYIFRVDSRRDKELVLRLGSWLLDNSLLLLEAPKVNVKNITTNIPENGLLDSLNGYSSWISKQGYGKAARRCIRRIFGSCM